MRGSAEYFVSRQKASQRDSERHPAIEQEEEGAGD